MNQTLIITLLLALPGGLLAADLTTNTGRTYERVQVTDVDADAIYIKHASGGAKIKFADLPEAWQRRYAARRAKAMLKEREEGNSAEDAGGSTTVQNVEILLKNGRTVTGRVVKKTSSKIIIRFPDGQLASYGRPAIEHMKVTKKTVTATTDAASAFAGEVVKHGIRKMKGKVIRVKGNRVYGNLGAKHGIEKEMVFVVTEEGDELVDPDTGKVLGAERRLVGRIEVIDVQEEFFKAVHVGDTEPDFQTGQILELENANDGVAVVPFVIADSDEINTSFGDLIIEGLVKNDVKVVERELVAKMLEEQLRNCPKITHRIS